MNICISARERQVLNLLGDDEIGYSRLFTSDKYPIPGMPEVVRELWFKGYVQQYITHEGLLLVLTKRGYQVYSTLKGEHVEGNDEN